MLSKSTWPVYKGDEKDGCRTILTDLNIRDDIAVGNTKIFIKSPESVRITCLSTLMPAAKKRS